MKKIRSFIIVLGLISITLISCTKATTNTYTPPSNPTKPVTPTYFFTSTINGTEVDGFSPTVVKTSADTIIATGDNGAGQVVVLKFPGTLGVGNHYGSSVGVTETYSLSGTVYTTTSSSVSLSITAVSATSIAGSFSFYCVSPINKTVTASVAGGGFKLKF